ncbi:SDR family NAD(P)-dependent oxidoreductase [Paraglaciecola sp. L1A13]|uniref:SDR family NAD(P)-dependent oxidoreductase n=1 Tax=Paraglaciecola sp. L1A13 TaxID=2686359 RepID=UPI00131CC0FE|nr:SDR family NAD(P)-dependent oxidoreductase [Paraglaciecola sp. L1A13]
MSDNSVAGKHILITGGASGIGAETALLLAKRGAKVTIGDLNEVDGKTLVERINDEGGQARFCKVDVSVSQSVEALFVSAIGELGNIDVLINNAGIDHDPKFLLEIEDATFHKNIAVNVNGVWYCMKQALGHMLENGGGHVINISSVAGIRAAPTLSAYSAAKHAVVGLTKSAAVEYARYNIRVNAVCPSFVRTPMVEHVLSKLNERGQKALISANPMKRLGEPQEIAGAIAWLCTAESSFMTGHTVVLDGGMTA